MTPDLWAKAPHFRQSEFNSPDLPGSGARMNPDVVFGLEKLRSLINKALRINSGYRTPLHNKAVGGAPHSAHLDGDAVDISTSGWTKQQRSDFIIYARQIGFHGVGIGSSFIHIDVKPRVASWKYTGKGMVAVPVGSEATYL